MVEQGVHQRRRVEPHALRPVKRALADGDAGDLAGFGGGNGAVKVGVVALAAERLVAFGFGGVVIKMQHTIAAPTIGKPTTGSTRSVFRKTSTPFEGVSVHATTRSISSPGLLYANRSSAGVSSTGTLAAKKVDARASVSSKRAVRAIGERELQMKDQSPDPLARSQPCFACKLHPPRGV